MDQDMSQMDTSSQSYQPPVNPFTQPQETQPTQGTQPASAAVSSSAQAQDNIESIQDHTVQINNPDSMTPKLKQPGVTDQIVGEYALLFTMQMNQNLFVTPESFKEKLASMAGVDNASSYAALEEQMAGIVTVNKYAALFKAQEVYNDIVSDMWEKFNKVIDDQNQQRQDWLSSAKYQAQVFERSPAGQIAKDHSTPTDAKAITDKGAASFQNYISSLSQEDKDVALNGLKANLRDDLHNAAIVGGFYSAERAPGSGISSYENISIMNGAVITVGANIDRIGLKDDHLVTDSVVARIVADSVIDMNQQVSPPLVQSMMAAELGLLGGLMAQSALWREGAASYVAGNATNNAHPNDVVFAKGYAQALLNFANGKGFEALINLVIIHHTHAGTEMSNDQKSEILSRLKLSLLALGVATLVQAQTGQMTGAQLKMLIDYPELAYDRRYTAINPELTMLLDAIRDVLPKDANARAEHTDSLRTSYDRGSADRKELLATHHLLFEGNVTSTHSYTEQQG